MADCKEILASQAQKKGKDGKGIRKMKKSKCWLRCMRKGLVSGTWVIRTTWAGTVKRWRTGKLIDWFTNMISARRITSGSQFISLHASVAHFFRNNVSSFCHWGSKTFSLFPASLATQGNNTRNNVSATMFPSLARPLRTSSKSARWNSDCQNNSGFSLQSIQNSHIRPVDFKFLSWL